MAGEIACNLLQVGDEGLLGVRSQVPWCTENGTGVNRGEPCFRKRSAKHPPALQRHAYCGAEQRLGSGRTERDYDAGREGFDLGVQPGVAGANLRRVRRLVDAPLSALRRHPLEVL